MNAQPLGPIGARLTIIDNVYGTEGGGTYNGVRLSEWDGEEVHFFTDGYIGDTPQRWFSFGVNRDITVTQIIEVTP